MPLTNPRHKPRIGSARDLNSLRRTLHEGWAGLRSARSLWRCARCGYRHGSVTGRYLLGSSLDTSIYDGRTRLYGAPRQVVDHGRGEYVRGDVHVNSAEGFFSLLKRGIVGTFHHVGKGHLGRYVREFEFRYNVRKLADKERPAVIVAGAEGKRLTYKQPAGASQN